MDKADILKLYKNLLITAKKLPGNQRSSMIDQIKGTFKANKTNKNLDDINILISKGQSTLSYLKMATPKIFKQSDPFRKVYTDDSNESRGRKPITNWTGSNMDPDSVARHNRSLKRAGFKNNAHAKGFF